MKSKKHEHDRVSRKCKSQSKLKSKRSRPIIDLLRANQYVWPHLRRGSSAEKQEEMASMLSFSESLGTYSEECDVVGGPGVCLFGRFAVVTKRVFSGATVSFPLGTGYVEGHE